MYARVNPELAADLEVMPEQVQTGEVAMREVELFDRGCQVLRPAIWCREAVQ